MPIRGHTPEESNFHSLIQFAAQHDEILRNHLDSCKENAKYLSSDIKNKLLELGAGQLLKSIVQDCNNASCYSSMADESTYIGIKEQISVCVRFVEKK